MNLFSSFSLLSLFLIAGNLYAQTWITKPLTHDPTYLLEDYRRHECAAAFCSMPGLHVGVVLGGRGTGDQRRPIIYHRAEDSLSMGTPPPLELHHFQAGVWQDSLILVGMAQTGGFPYEDPVDSLYFYDVKNDLWQALDSIPLPRQRGSAQMVIHGDWAYFFNGITNGHHNGWVKQTDRYNLVTNTWEILTDSPRERDHAIALKDGDYVYIVGGRRSNAWAAGGMHAYPVYEIDRYHIPTDTWITLPPTVNLGDFRAGLMGAILPNDLGHAQLNVWGGEQAAGPIGGLASGDGLDLTLLTWQALPDMPVKRHATQMMVIPPDTLVMLAGAQYGGDEYDPSDLEYAIEFTQPVILPMAWVATELRPYREQQLAIHWEAQETGVAEYEILTRTTPLSSPVTLATVPAHGNGTYRYAYTTPRPEQPCYYQIRAWSHDGTVNMSSLMAWNQPPDMDVYPTRLPAGGFLTLRNSVQPLELTLTGMDGRQHWAANSDQDQIQLPTTLSPGMYLLRIRQANGSIVRKIIVD